MKIAFVDLILWDYYIENVKTRPIGGTQSAISYLAMNMADLGHDVFLLNNISAPTISCGVACLPLSALNSEFWCKLNLVIVVNCVGAGTDIRGLCGHNPLLILWMHHAADQPSVEDLAIQAEKDSYDHFVFISNWQKNEYVTKFQIDPDKIVIFKNAIAPVFENLLKYDEVIVEQKLDPLTLVYTSTPFRGLNLLLNIFPRIKKECPDIKLKIYSSMRVYGCSESEDQLQHGNIYDRCRRMDGVEYIGSIPQQQLAEELKKVTILAYPNTFAETSCIAVMEAMASGCYVITSELGALPETTARFGQLISFRDGIEAYTDKFVEATIDFLNKLKSDSKIEVESQLKQQIEYCQKEYNWRNRANEWLQYLYKMKAHKCFNEGDFLLASEIYQEALSFYPSLLEYSCYLILCWIILEDNAQAFSLLWLITEELQNDESEEFMQLLEAITSQEIKRFKEAQNLLVTSKIEDFFSTLN